MLLWQKPNLMNLAEWRWTWAWWLNSDQIAQCVVDGANATNSVLDEIPRQVLDKILDWTYKLWEYSPIRDLNRSVVLSTQIYTHKFKLNNWKVLEIKFLPDINTEIIIGYDWKEDRIVITEDERIWLARKISEIHTPPVYHSDWRWAWVNN